MRNDDFFSNAPQLTDITRSRFDRSSNLHTSFNAGRLIPIYLSEVLPADTCNMTLSSSVRMSTPITPVQDDCYLDTYFFFVPSRLCWNRWEEFNGENVRGNWISRVDENIRVPMCAYNKKCSRTFDETTKTYTTDDMEYPECDLEGTLIDYFGLPYLNMFDWRDDDDTSYDLTDKFSLLPFEAYNLVWNEFFRDQNVSEPCPLKLQDTSVFDPQSVSGVYAETNEYDLADGSSHYSPWKVNQSYFSVKFAGKLHDYFTSALPQPQKHAPIALPGFPTELVDGSSSLRIVMGNQYLLENTIPLNFKTTLNDNNYRTKDLHLNNVGGTFASDSSSTTDDNASYVAPNNMYGLFDVSRVPNINDLRNAFALQNLFEVDALGGSRYIESLYHHFGVMNPDSRLQRPEYLGGERVLIGMEQVVQTSATNEVSPQGNVSGLSLTNHIGSRFTKSFTEHGYIIGLAVVRPKHSYQNGIEKLWSRERRFDFYYPELSNIGEQPIYYRELCAGMHKTTPENGGVHGDMAFGYQEPWAEYRYDKNRVTGKMRSLLPDSLDIWHYADVFDQFNATVPILSDAFISETGETIDRTLALPLSKQPQFFGDFHFESVWTRPMPVYSVPGYLTNH